MNEEQIDFEKRAHLLACNELPDTTREVIELLRKLNDRLSVIEDFHDGNEFDNIDE